MATGYTGDVQECEEVWQEWHRVLCAHLISFVLLILTFNLLLCDLGEESRGISEAVSHREENAENDLLNDVEG